MKTYSVLFAAAEMTPLAKAGGLGDVIGALPKALQRYVEKTTVALPFHDSIQKSALRRLRKAGTVTVTVHGKAVSVAVWKAIYPDTNTPLLLFKQPDFLSGGGIYDGLSVLNPLTGKLTLKDGLGQRIRYLFFSYALYAYLQQQPKLFDIIHVHDFHVAPLAALIEHDHKLRSLKTLVTIHNLAYTGSLPKPYWEMFEPAIHHLFDVTERRRPKGPRMLWQGLQWADAITTVSPQYAKEILTPEYGNDFELLLQRRQRHLYSILNGLDTNTFNPKTDPAIQRHYSLRSLERRSENKRFLQQHCRLPVNRHVPIIGIVARLTTQKGMNLIMNVLPELTALPAQFVVCGDGPAHIMKAFQDTAKQYPNRWHFHNRFDTVFSQYVYGGSDIFLMPSRHEPCGLAQMIAMRYGAVPVVRATGGLKDTVQDGYNGFLFTKYSSAAMLTAIQRAIRVYQNQPQRWLKLITHGMTGNYSWDRSAKAYADLYTKLLHTKNK